MKFTQSIQWRLLSWITVLLGCSLLALDIAAYEIYFSRTIGQLDEELNRRASVISTTIFSPPSWDDIEGLPPGGTPRRRPVPPDGFFGGPGPGSREDFPMPPIDESQIIPLEKRYQADGTNGYYFVIWSEDSSWRSTNAPADVSRPRLPARDAEAYLRTRDGFRESYHGPEPIACVLVGHTLAPAMAEARRFGEILAMGSLFVLALGLGGVWLIVARALRPVGKISAAAVKIASGDLSQRINVADTESELGQLAVVLNSTFARLDAAFTRQKQFTADAAHELRTPVSVLLTHAQNGLAAGCDCGEHREAFEACQRAARRMKKLIGALLALARLDNGQGESQWRTFDLSRTVRESVEMLRPLAAERQVRLFTDLAEQDFMGDAEQLAQVVTNLLVNAIQYNRPGGEVRVKLERRLNQAVLTVSDTGTGITAEDLPRVFERFYRADKSRTGGGGHTGLGLAISKAIVEAHGGSLEASSQPGAGATFRVRLPEGN